MDWKTLGRKLKISQGKVLSKLCLFAVFVIADVKPAYLVDTCFLKIAQANMLLDELCKLVGRDRSSVKAIEVGSDIFLINEKLVRDRLQSMIALLSNGCVDGESFTVIHLDCDTSSSVIADEHIQTYPGSASNESFAAPLSDFSQLLFMSSLGESISIPTNTIMFQSLGGPTIAGILLGYPCIYKAAPLTSPDVNNEDDSQLYAYASRKLSYRTLRKIIISATISTNVPFLSQWSPVGRGPMTVPVYEFTIPVLSHSSSVMDKVSRVVDLFYNNLPDAFDPGMLTFSGWQRSDELWETEGITL